MSMADASLHCGDDLNVDLLKTLDLTLLEAFRASFTAFPMAFWMGLETTLSETCTDAACVNNTGVLWEDGSMMMSDVPAGVTVNLDSTSRCVKMTMTSDNPKFTMTSEPCSNKLTVVCEVPCKHTAPVVCPSDYPFATAHGQQCSRYYERKVSGGMMCDGLLLKTDPIECCIDCVSCPVSDRSCIDAVKAHEFCPTNSNATRSEGHTGFIKTNASQLEIRWLSAQNYCVDNFQAHLPFIKNMRDLIVLTRLYGASNSFWLGGFATYEVREPAACDPPNECEWLDGSGVDLSFYEHFDLNYGSKLLILNTNPNPKLAQIVKDNLKPNETACQASCSFYQDRALCPTTHPVAIQNGENCCAHFSQSTVNGCAGNVLDLTDPIKCCPNNTLCPDLVKGCKSHPSQALLCPPYSGAIRMGNKAFQPIVGPDQTYNEAKATCQDLGGFLPIVKTMKDFENHFFAHVLKELSTGRYWISLRHDAGLQSCSDAECNEQVLQWADGSRFVYEDLNKTIANRETETCYVIKPHLTRPSLGSIDGTGCTTNRKVLCEFACS